jgi:hypothetical protein
MIAIYPRAEELTGDSLVLEVHGLTTHRPGGLLLKAKLPLLLQLLLVVPYDLLEAVRIDAGGPIRTLNEI